MSSTYFTEHLLFCVLSKDRMQPGKQSQCSCNICECLIIIISLFICLLHHPSPVFAGSCPRPSCCIRHQSCFASALHMGIILHLNGTLHFFLHKMKYRDNFYFYQKSTLFYNTSHNMHLQATTTMFSICYRKIHTSW